MATSKASAKKHAARARRKRVSGLMPAATPRVPWAAKDAEPPAAEADQRPEPILDIPVPSAPKVPLWRRWLRAFLDTF